MKIKQRKQRFLVQQINKYYKLLFTHWYQNGRRRPSARTYFTSHLKNRLVSVFVFQFIFLWNWTESLVIFSLPLILLWSYLCWRWKVFSGSVLVKFVVSDHYFHPEARRNQLLNKNIHLWTSYNIKWNEINLYISVPTLRLFKAFFFFKRCELNPSWEIFQQMFVSSF